MMRFLACVAAVALLTGCATTETRVESMTGEPAAAVKTTPAADFSAYLDRDPLLPDYQRIEFDNGLVLLLLEKPEVPLVGFEAVLRGGAVADPIGKEGTASLLAELLRKGAGDRDAGEFAATVEGVGGALNTGAGLESLRISGGFLAKDAELAVSLLADMLLRPHLDAAEFGKLRDRSIQFIKAAKDGSPNQLLPYYSAGFVFGDHPYGRPSSGTETSLAGLSVGDVRDFYSDHFGADRVILAVAGDFDAKRMVSMLRDAFADWKPATAALPAYDAAPAVTGDRVFLIDKPDATQTYFWMGNIGVSKYYPQRAPLALTNTVFGGSFTSMLNTELRIKSGLTYGARSTVRQPRRKGSIGISSFTATETTVDAMDLALETLDRLHNDGLTEQQILSAKSYILGQFPLGFETARQLARQAAQLEFYNLERDWINAYAGQIVATDQDDTGAVIDEVYPQRNQLVYVLIGNAAAIRDAVSKYGQITEISITEPRFKP